MCANNLKIEGRLLKKIEELKSHGGPFTNSKEIEDFINDSNIDAKVQTKRMKTEVMYSRDTSLSVPKSNPVFRIRSQRIPGRRIRQLTYNEFGENLKILMDKKMEAIGKTISIKAFADKIDDLAKKLFV